MKIAIISDLHDNISNLHRFFQAIAKEKIEKIISCGDLGNQDTLKTLIKNFNKEIFIISGNADIYNFSDLENYKHINNLGRSSSFNLGKFKIAVCHEPIFIKSLLKENPDLDFIFYGHTHKPWISKKNKTILINPGTLGGLFYRPSFAIWDSENGKVNLKLIH